MRALPFYGRGVTLVGRAGPDPLEDPMADAGSPTDRRPAPIKGRAAVARQLAESASPVLGNPANRRRAIALTFDQFKYHPAASAARGVHGITMCSGGRSSWREYRRAQN